MSATRNCKKCGWMLIEGKCAACAGSRLLERQRNQGKSTYGRGSTSGGYGRSSYSYQSATFDGLPALKRTRQDGATEFFYHEGAVDEVNLDDRSHGHAVIKNGKLVYKRLPGQENPVVNRE